ncbi:MAG: ketoacyl-ACP synthase III [Lentisphaeria bacterium]|nr:ketoacyl-ACP synthase III [Lentisphaeria bacterium]
MPYKHVKIAGTGSYLPDRVVTNDDLAVKLDTNDEWIFSHTGIRQRRIADDSQSPVDMAFEASQKALAEAGMEPDELGMILLSTCTGDYNYLPSSACLLQHRLGANNAGAFDLLAACSGFVYCLEMARCWAVCNQKPVLIVANEMLSRITDWESRETCILFGDGAAAVILTPSRENGLLYSYLGADGENSRLLYVDGGSRLARGREPIAPSYVQMQGRTTFSIAVRALEQVVLKILKDNKLQIEDIAHIIPHQANMRILETLAKRLNIPIERLHANIDRVANTSSASIPILLDELKEQGKLKPNDLILTVAFGGGLTYGGNLIRWQPES